MNDLASIVHAVTIEAYELADKTGRLPERIKVEANFDMDYSGGLLLNRSSHTPGQCKVTMELRPQAVPAGLKLMTDHAANQILAGRKKTTRKRVNKSILYRRQGGYCAGCSHYFQSRNLTIDHFVPRSKGGSSDIPNLQLLCHACNQMKADGLQEQLLTELREQGHINPGLHVGL